MSNYLKKAIEGNKKDTYVGTILFDKEYQQDNLEKLRQLVIGNESEVTVKTERLRLENPKYPTQDDYKTAHTTIKRNEDPFELILDDSTVWIFDQFRENGIITLSSNNSAVYDVKVAFRLNEDVGMTMNLSYDFSRADNLTSLSSEIKKAKSLLKFFGKNEDKEYMMDLDFQEKYISVLEEISIAQNITFDMKKLGENFEEETEVLELYCSVVIGVPIKQDLQNAKISLSMEIPFEQVDKVQNTEKLNIDFKTESILTLYDNKVNVYSIMSYYWLENPQFGAKKESGKVSMTYDKITEPSMLITKSFLSKDKRDEEHEQGVSKTDVYESAETLSNLVSHKN